jgi:hypothetical protein
MARKLKRRLKGKRFTKAHSDGKISTIIRNIQKIYNLPKGSVLFVKPGKKKMRRDAKISSLRKAWA